jgi:hypothetical protein
MIEFWVAPEQEDRFCCGIRLTERKINVPRGTITPGKLALGRYGRICG